MKPAEETRGGWFEGERIKRTIPRFIMPDWMIGNEKAVFRALYFALIAARVGVVEWQGIAYALTWDAGE